MNGELILKNSGRWKQTLPAVVLTIGATFLFVWPLMTRVQTGGIMRGIMAALVTYILFRCLYPVLAKAMPGGEKNITLTWEVTWDALKLGEDSIPLDSIKQVHCWPNRDALGNSLAGWIVNIETTGKNRMLCSVEEGPEVETSVEGLHEMVKALGYGERWVEE